MFSAISIAVKSVLFAEVAELGGVVMDKVMSVFPEVTPQTRARDLKTMIARFLLITRMICAFINDIADMKVIPGKSLHERVSTQGVVG